MLAKERARGPIVVLEAGGSLGPPATRAAPSEHELGQRRIKAELIAKAWAQGGLDAMALGASDWALGTEFVRSLVEANRLPVLAANLTCGGTKPYPASKVLEVEGHRLGIVGVTLGEVEGCEVGEVVPALDAAVAELGAVDVVVGLVPVETDRALGQLGEAPAVDARASSGPTALAAQLVIDARGKFAQAGPESRGRTWFLGAGSRGKHVGTLTLEFVPGATGWAATGEGDRLEKQLEQARARITGLDQRIAKAKSDDERSRWEAQRAAYERNLGELEQKKRTLSVPGGVNRFTLAAVELGDSVADEPATAGLVAEAKSRITTTTAAGGDPGKFVPRVVADPASPYAGGQVCSGCHAAEHAQWSTTAHARAWQTLVRVDRALDEQCWGCHVTGHRQEGGPPTAVDSGPWRDVQCEACHGPGRAHVGAPAEVDPVRSPPLETCTGCHDGEQDGGRFDPATYLPQVVHTPPAPVP